MDTPKKLQQNNINKHFHIFVIIYTTLEHFLTIIEPEEWIKFMFFPKLLHNLEGKEVSSENNLLYYFPRYSVKISKLVLCLMIHVLSLDFPLSVLCKAELFDL